MKTCLVLGRNSDIYRGIRPMLESDGWRLVELGRGDSARDLPQWNLCIITMGRVAPVGHWWDLDIAEFRECFDSNLLTPWSLLRDAWQYRAPDATVIWFSGSNPQIIMDGYAPYNAAKMAVNKLIEQLDHETWDAKFVAFAPGYVRDSKIHRATIEKGWPNPRIARGDAGNSMATIYRAMKWCIEQPKQVVGGRNVCASDVPFDFPLHDSFKLRRVGR